MQAARRLYTTERWARLRWVLVTKTLFYNTDAG